MSNKFKNRFIKKKEIKQEKKIDKSQKKLTTHALTF